MTSLESEIQGENITVKVDMKPGCQVLMDVTVNPKATKATYNKALKTVNKEVSLPGFRKGKAPDAIIIQNFGKYVEQEWQQILIETAFKEALDITKLSPFSENSIKRPEVKEASREDGAKIKFKFESYPKIPNVDLSNIKLKKPERQTINKEQVEQSLEEIRLHHAEWTDVTDRGAQENDYVDIDIENLDKNNEKICSDARFHIAEGKMGKWMRNLVIGLKTGESAEGVSEKDEDSTAESFIPTNCRITVKKINTAALPEINDELAVKVGLETADELKERLEVDLNKQSDEAVQIQLREQLETFLLEQYPFELPQSLTEAELTQRLPQAQAELGDNPTEEDFQELRGKVANDVDDAFRLFFLSRQVADNNNIDVSQEEILQELMHQMYSPEGQTMLASSTEPGEVRSRVYVTLLTKKAKDFLIDKATIE